MTFKRAEKPDWANLGFDFRHYNTTSLTPPTSYTHIHTYIETYTTTSWSRHNIHDHRHTAHTYTWHTNTSMHTQTQTHTFTDNTCAHMKSTYTHAYTHPYINTFSQTHMIQAQYPPTHKRRQNNNNYWNLTIPINPAICNNSFRKHWKLFIIVINAFSHTKKSEINFRLDRNSVRARMDYVNRGKTESCEEFEPNTVCVKLDRPDHKSALLQRQFYSIIKSAGLGGWVERSARKAFSSFQRNSSFFDRLFTGALFVIFPPSSTMFIAMLLLLFLLLYGRRSDKYFFHFPEESEEERFSLLPSRRGEMKVSPRRASLSFSLSFSLSLSLFLLFLIFTSRLRFCWTIIIFETLWNSHFENLLTVFVFVKILCVDNHMCVRCFLVGVCVCAQESFKFSFIEFCNSKNV